MANRVQRVSLQFKGQRKPQDYVVYPKSYEGTGEGYDGNTRLMFQSDKATGCVYIQDHKEFKAGDCFYQPKSDRFYMLGQLGTVRFTMDQETIEKLKAAQPQSGDQIGPGVFVA